MSTTTSPSKPLVYLAGPYMKPYPIWNMHTAIKLADKLLDVCVPVVPHLTGIWDLISPKPYEQWLEIDLVVMQHCDLVFRFEGESSGADAEVEKAKEWNIPVVYSEKELRVRLMEGLGKRGG